MDGLNKITLDQLIMGISIITTPFLLIFLVFAIQRYCCGRRRQLSATDIEAGQSPQIQQQQQQQQQQQVLVSIKPQQSEDQGIKIKEIVILCTECAICLGDYESEESGVACRTLKPCGHRFHTLCIDALWESERKWCPICRGLVQKFNHPSSSVRGDCLADAE